MIGSSIFPHDIMDNNITLACLVEKDDPYGNCFDVEINKMRAICVLKDLIKDKRKPRFDHLPANELRLWKVNVSLVKSNENNKLEVLVKRETAVIKEKLEGEKLLALKDVQDYFGDQPHKNHIHIIIECPPGE